VQGRKSYTTPSVRVIFQQLTKAIERCRDAFAGGFLAGLAQKQPLETCIDMGHWLASLGVREMGPKYVLMCLKYYGLANMNSHRSMTLTGSSVIRRQNNSTSPLDE
jgi:hypothetical protein